MRQWYGVVYNKIFDLGYLFMVKEIGYSGS